jgi:hypothetical protein
MSKSKSGVVGFVIGALGIYLGAKAYQRARQSCPPFRRVTYRDPWELLADTQDLWRQPQSLLSLRNNPRLQHPFVDRIMLAALSAWGGGPAQRAAARSALARGLSQEEADSLLRGELQYGPVDEAPAIIFAQHYAETRGQPEHDMLQRLVDAYGWDTARDLLILLQLITLANLSGNAVDALISRALGKPNADTTLRQELAVVLTLLVGALPLMVSLAWRTWRASVCDASQREQPA